MDATRTEHTPPSARWHLGGVNALRREEKEGAWQNGEEERRKTKSFGWTVIEKAIEFKIDQLKVSPTVPLPVIKTWLLSDAIVDFKLLEKNNKEKECNSCNAQTYINENHRYVQIYTDASKSIEYKIGVAFIVPEFQVSIRKMISDEISVYKGEICTKISNTVDRRDETFETSCLFRLKFIIG